MKNLHGGVQSLPRLLSLPEAHGHHCQKPMVTTARSLWSSLHAHMALFYIVRIVTQL